MPKSNTGQLRVLVVDDQNVMRKIIRNLLKQVGIEQVEEAENGREALEYLCASQKKPDVIISDLIMDEMSGLEFLNNVRRDKNLSNCDIPIIILTGESNDLLLDVTRQVGAASILNKPVTATELLEAIEVAVGFVLSSTMPETDLKKTPSSAKSSVFHEL